MLGRRALLHAGLVLPFATVLPRPQAHAATATSSVDAMLATPWQARLHPADYLVSEKLDGVRALWDGSTLRFRSGRPIAAPAWFLASLPAISLDGELWAGWRSFDALSGAVRKDVPVDAEWRTLRYMVFDLPHDRRPFAQRASYLADLLAATAQPWLQAVAQTTVPDAAALQARLKKVVAGGGEGLVLHRADALWMPGRSEALRKLKVQSDEEGTVLAHVAGRGKYQGRMGALLLQTPDGQRFALGTGFSDADRANPPAVGSVVTYRYRDRTVTGLPKFASFLRVRAAE
ncbi:DNA ligase [Rhodoferax lacus]|uniref:DNA ligase n=2 Tax=Rhodoferax lacus TaxID=2184758 RepID=A0A3E1RCK2_9BURK|nr:DNA ligase [Rhodoferax lacus]